MKTFLKSLPAALLILLFVYAAASKLHSTGDFRRQLHLQPFPHEVADALLYLLPAAEIITVLLLLFSRTYFLGLRAALSLLLLFTGYIVLVKLHYWPHVPCSCGGILSHMSWSAHLVFNLLFLAVSLVAVKVHIADARQQPAR